VLEEARFAIESGERTHGTFLQDIANEALNPKTALFFLSFIPQFVSAARVRDGHGRIARVRR
jgi:threonine/homoserine/homoserine lactone efflux protein